MSLDSEILYMPCPCGSGSKFKFCCWKKYRDRIDDSMTRARVVQAVRCENSGVYAPRPNREAQELSDEAREMLIEDHDTEKAMELLRKAAELDPEDASIWNNAAICEWEAGHAEAAAEWQRQGIEKANSYRNTFGFASMAIYLHALGRDDEAAGWLERALEDRLPLSRDVVVRVCFALALYRRHRDILDYAADSCLDDDSRVAFFKAVALANLGRTAEAAEVLRDADEFALIHPVGRYLECIGDGCTPRSVRSGEWPYFTLSMFPPARWLDEDLREGRNPFDRPSGTIVDAIEVLAAESFRTPAELLKLIQGREDAGMEELRKGLERLAKEDADPALPPGVTEARDEARRLFIHPIPKWKLELEYDGESEPEDEAERLLDGFVLPYNDRHCQLFSEDGDLPHELALLVVPQEERPELGMCPDVELVPRERIWDALSDALVDFFENCNDDKSLCEVRCDPMFGGPILTIRNGNRTESFMIAVPERNKWG
ncbi:MAG: hypothetical protein IKQ55_00120 [Kiritimatiellae bacterium]|nr:hypothetical protein [Kiritimatiellia bacterium]